MNNLPPKKSQFSLFNIPRYCRQVSHIPGLFMFMNSVFGGFVPGLGYSAVGVRRETCR